MAERKIIIKNFTRFKLDNSLFKKTIQYLFSQEKRKGVATLSLLFVGARRMRKLNKNYRKKDKVTDVLTFDLRKGLKFPGISASQKDEGEIVICLTEVRAEARKLHLPFKQIIIKVLIHGLLHLLGYTHEHSSRKAKIMQLREKKYFTFIIDSL